MGRRRLACGGRVVDVGQIVGERETDKERKRERKREGKSRRWPHLLIRKEPNKLTLSTGGRLLAAKINTCDFKKHTCKNTYMHACLCSTIGL